MQRSALHLPHSVARPRATECANAMFLQRSRWVWNKTLKPFNRVTFCKGQPNTRFEYGFMEIAKL